MRFILQTGVIDVTAATDAQLQHDSKVAAPGNIQLRVLNVPEHDCR